MIFKVFTKENCPKCHELLEYCRNRRGDDLEYQVYDISTADGLAEASYYGVLATPTIIQVNEEGEETQKMVLDEIDTLIVSKENNGSRKLS